MARQRIVYEDIRIPSRLDETRVFDRVAAHHDGAAGVIEAIAERRDHGPVVHRERGDLESVLLEHDGRRHDRPRLHPADVLRQKSCAVVGDAVARVERIGLLEARHHAFDTRRPEDTQGTGTAGDPGLHVEFTQIADVVGVKVREKDGADAAPGDAPERELVPGARAGIHDPQAPGREHRDAGLGTIPVREGRRAAAQEHAQGVVLEEIVCGGSHGPGQHAFHQAVLDRGKLKQGNTESRRRPTRLPPATGTRGASSPPCLEAAA